MPQCPCTSGKSFDQCCGPIIHDHSAPTALKLMRSRYTAYHQSNAQYLYQTTHPDTRSQHNINDIQEWSKQNTWAKLEIISVEHGNVNDTNGIVEFKAYYLDKNGKESVHHERSTFMKSDGQWFYLNGKINPPETALMKKISRNDPCPCGSGKKYKKCCA